jgi:hypothetical protein
VKYFHLRTSPWFVHVWTLLLEQPLCAWLLFYLNIQPSRMLGPSSCWGKVWKICYVTSWKEEENPVCESSSEYYLNTPSLPQRKHSTSLL